MGFYGNITNTSRTTFQFDKIYPNRLAMDTMCATDEVYNGRYVLIEYDHDLENTAYRKNWYLIQTDTHNYLYSDSPSIQGENREDILNYYNLDLKVKVTKADLENNPNLIYLEKGHIFSNVNDEIKLVEFEGNEIIAEYDIDNDEEFEEWRTLLTTNLPADEVSQFKGNINAGNNLTMYGAYYVNIVNENVYALDDISGVDQTNSERGIAGIVKKGSQYNYNVIGQMWKISDIYTEDGIQYYDFDIPNEDEDSYTKNFNTDKEYYNSSRGFDSTVWQKVFVNGVEQYVMIAELNTVVPTFGVAGDAPTLLPINPHWGSNSTNVYYELHWQPSWGFRIKAANPMLSTPVIDSSTGTLLRDGGRSWLRLNDDIKYPSDVKVKWKYTFEDNGLPAPNSKSTVYYNPVQQNWTTDESLGEVPAAIYYNKEGFDPDRVFYSEDLISETIYPNWTNDNYIELSPTGLSGNLYNRHDGVYGKIPQIDTQEFSLMLPAIGDMLASVWDLIYGGRNTNNAIRQTNKRNKNIKWEDGPEFFERKGLRLTYNKNGINPLTGDDDVIGYDTRAIETLAGCINTAHDLFGMIIKKIPESIQMSDTSFKRATLAEINSNPTNFIPDFNDNRIYFLEAEQKYYRKVDAYWFEEIDEKFYNYMPIQNTSQLTSETIHDGSYYVWDESEEKYVQVKPEDVFDPNKEYYYKTVGDVYTEVEGAFFDFPYKEGNHIYDYYRLPARQITLSEAYVQLPTGTQPSAVVNTDLYIYSENNERYIPYSNYTNEQLIENIQQGKIYTSNKDNPIFYHYLKAAHDVGKDYYTFITDPSRVVLNDIYEPKKYFYINEDSTSMPSEIEKVLIRENAAEPDPGKQYYTIDSSLTREGNKLGSSGFGKLYLYIPGKYYFLAKRDLGNTYVEDGYYVDDSEDGHNIKLHGEISEQIGSVSKIRCYAAKDIKQQINPNGEYVTYIKEIKYYQIVQDAEPLKYTQADINDWINSHESGAQCPFVINTNKVFTEEDYNNYQSLHNGQKPPWQVGNFVYDINYETQVVIQNFEDTYKPFVYYLLNGIQNTYFICEDQSYNSSKTYYLRTESYQLNNKTTYSIRDVLDLDTEIYYGQLFFYADETYFTIEQKDPETLEPVKYRFLSKKRLQAMIQESSLDTDQIYTLGENDQGKFVSLSSFLMGINNLIPQGHDPIIEAVSVFYQPNVYHYKDSNNNYILSSDPYDPNRTYYKINPNSIKKAPDGILYKKEEGEDSYFYESDGEYIEVSSSNIQGQIDPEGNSNNIVIDSLVVEEDIKVYEKADVYVAQDTSGKLPIGMKWNIHSLCIPESVTLGTRYSKSQLEELTNYATEESTINGLILKTLETLAPHDIYTRNLNTVAGGINSMKDVLATIGEISSRDLTIIDDAGRINGAPIITWQNPNMISTSGTHVNGQITEKRWLAATVDGNISNPEIHLSHLYSPVADTYDSINMNDDPQTIGNESLNSILIKEAIKDETGHVICFNNKTITFPNNFGLITDGINSLRADSPHATLQIVSDINHLITPVIQNNTLSFEHNSPDLNAHLPAKAGNAANGDANMEVPLHQGTISLSFGGSFNVPYIETDSCGHIKNLRQDTIQIPSLSVITIEKSQVNGLQEDLSSIESSYNNLSREVDTINVAIGNNTIYTPDNSETPENELKRVTIQQLTSRVAQLEEVIRRLISIDENTNSMVVLSNDEIDEILDWDRITIDNSNITVTFDHADNQSDESIDGYLISDWVRRAQFGAYTGNGTPKYYALNNTLQTPAYEEITLPFALTRNFIETYGELSINETEGEVRIVEALTPPTYSAP